MKNQWVGVALAMVSLGISIGPQGITVVTPAPAYAQTVPPREMLIPLTRARNLARQKAATANGGSGRYQAEPRMLGNIRNAPYVTNPDGSWTFTFLGGAPGSSSYTVQSVVRVTPDWAVTLEYNGPIR